jgi:hypothetical protein
MFEIQAVMLTAMIFTGIGKIPRRGNPYSSKLLPVLVEISEHQTVFRVQLFLISEEIMRAGIRVKSFLLSDVWPPTRRVQN